MNLLHPLEPLLEPLIGAWYQGKEQNSWFEVVALDDKAETVEVQYVDGSIAEFDIEHWQQLSLRRAAAPEDSKAGYELSIEDYWNEDEINTSLDSISLTNALALLEPDTFPAIEDF